PGPCSPTLDLSQCAVRMRSIESGLSSDAEAFQWTEAARLSLAHRRPRAAPVETLRSRMRDAEQIRRSAVDEDTLRAMFHAKFGNPMLGIYGAHLLLLNPACDRALLREVATN